MTTLDENRIVRPLGHGGMGVVYEAESTAGPPGGPDRFAIKILDREWTRAIRAKRPIAVALLDIDSFKLYKPVVYMLLSVMLIAQQYSALNSYWDLYVPYKSVLEAER